MVKPPTEIYTLLGITVLATQDEVKEAWRRFARRWSPDVCTEPDCAKWFDAGRKGKDLLLDVEARRRYDFEQGFLNLTPAEGPPPTIPGRRILFGVELVEKTDIVTGETFLWLPRGITFQLRQLGGFRKDKMFWDLGPIERRKFFPHDPLLQDQIQTFIRQELSPAWMIFEILSEEFVQAAIEGRLGL